jgi:hypothetical protein
VHGQWGVVEDAPLTALLSVVMGAEPAITSVASGPASLTIFRHGCWRRKVSVTPPAPVRGLVEAFEAGRCPLLEPEGFIGPPSDID